jgi:hypothetical protein
MTSVKETFKEYFNENIYNDPFIMIPNNESINLRILHNVDEFLTFMGHPKDNKIYLCNKNNDFVNGALCIHCYKNIKIIKMVFTKALLCNHEGDPLHNDIRIWILPKFKFQDIFIPFHKYFKNKPYIMKHYVFTIKNNNGFINIKYKYINDEITYNEKSLNEIIMILKERYKDSNNDVDNES